MNQVQESNTSEKTDNITPMMRQYMAQKRKHPDAILLFRMGDFYELFFEDASKASRILDIALTTRDRNKANGIPMCGFPHKSSSMYISKLLAAGERVAICDQVEDPKLAKGLVKREVTRVVTPGLVDDPEVISANENHFICSISRIETELGLAALDLSTGEFLVTITTELTLASQELKRIDPKETLIAREGLTDDEVQSVLSEEIYRHELESYFFDPKSCEESLREYFGVQSLVGFGFHDRRPLVSAAGALIQYIRENRSEKPSHIKAPRFYSLDSFMILDQSTIRNLEIFRNLRDGSSKGSLISVIDTTKTSMGGRLLRKWISYPLMDVEAIEKRLDLTGSFVDHFQIRRELRDFLTNFADLERLSAKISLRTALPRDLAHLRFSCAKIPAIIGLLKGFETDPGLNLTEIDDLSCVVQAIEAVIVEDPPNSLKDGGVIRKGYNAELDELREIGKSGRAWIAGIEKREREQTGIPNLKVGYTRVFGYYIEVTRSHQEKVPVHYSRKQTLVGSERYVTEELKEHELKVLNAQERILELEEELFSILRSKLIELIDRIQNAAMQIAKWDVSSSLAEVAVTNSYVRPKITDSDVISIVEGRHPVVESFVSSEVYIPNDTTLDHTKNQILVITGPNMAGKSTYMRQTALIALMAQIGSFVPAKEASVGIVDRIFTRIGASDYLSFGQSTFMVEMNETAEILNSASYRSLAILDEVGRGTSTFDGLAIAWAVIEFLHDMPGDGGPRTLFATHYHELVDIALVKERVSNFNFEVRQWNNRIVFLRKIAPGGASRSYGLQVARLAGIPDSVLQRASEILNNLEKEEIDPGGIPKLSRTKTSRLKEKIKELAQIELFGSPADELLQEIQAVDIDRTSPVEALNILWELKKKYSTF